MKPITFDRLVDKMTKYGYTDPARIASHPSTGIFAFHGYHSITSTALPSYLDFLKSGLITQDSLLTLLNKKNLNIVKEHFADISRIREYTPCLVDKHANSFYFPFKANRIVKDFCTEGVSSSNARRILSALGINVGKTRLRDMHESGECTADAFTKGGHRRYLFTTLMDFVELKAAVSNQLLVMYLDCSFGVGVEPTLNDIRRFFPGTAPTLIRGGKSPVSALRNTSIAHYSYTALVIKNCYPPRILTPIMKYCRDNSINIIILND